MEEKIKLFKSYDWNGSREWQQYYENLYPKPPSNRLDYWRKKFYKLKVDSEFDLTYEFESGIPNDSNNHQNQQQSSSSQHNNTYFRSHNNNSTSSSNSNTNQTNSSNNSPPSNQTQIQAIEGVIFSLFLLSIIPKYYTLHLSCLGFIVKIIKKFGVPKLNTQYFQALFNESIFHQLVYSLILFIDRINLFTLFPIIITALLTVGLFVKKNFPQYPKLVQYSQNILNNQALLKRLSSRIELGIGALLVVGIFLGMNSFLLPLIYWQFIRFKYVVSTELKQTFTEANQYLNQIKSNPSCPNIASLLISKLQLFVEYICPSQPSN